MKRPVCLCLCLALLLVLCACGSQSESTQSTPQQEQAQEAQQASSVRQIRLIRSRANDHEFIELAEDNRFLARAVLPDRNTSVDHWEINGSPADASGRRFSLEFDSQDVYLVEAVLRPNKTLSCVNAYLQFLDTDGNPAGTKYSSVTFEDDYYSPVTGEPHLGGSISAHITAFVPAGKEVDYWLINGAPYLFGSSVKEFTVVGLQESATYEAVLKDASASGISVKTLLENYGETGLTVLPPPIEDDIPVGNGSEPLDRDKWVDFGVGEPDGTTFVGETSSGTSTTSPGASAHQHSYYLDYTVPASCTNDGYERYVCSKCGASYTQTIPSTGHSYYWQYDYRGHWQVCSVCGATTAVESHSMNTNVEYPWAWKCDVCGYHERQIN